MQTMTETQKNRFNAVSTLRSWAWDSFTERREFEGKINIGVWTALSAIIGILLGRGVSIEHRQEFVEWGSVAFAIVLTLLHVYYIWGLEIAQRRDRDSVHEYDELLEKEFGPFLSKPLKNSKTIYKERTGFLRSYSHIFEVGLTTLLSLSLVAVTLIKIRH
jgi:uncharacterized membrane protein YfcA